MKIAVSILIGLSGLGLQIQPVNAQGSLTPPGPPGPTMVTLSQVEPRTPISSAPFVITQPGSYYLTTSLTVSGGNAITIATNGVMLDLNGFTISSSAATAAGYGILISSHLRNITIANGFIQGGVTNNGSNIYSGAGFDYGIAYSSFQPVNVLVSRISVSGCQLDGIYAGDGDSIVVEFCTARTIGSFGIVASTISHSSAIDCGGDAIYADQVSDCRGETTVSGTAITATTAQNSYAYNNGSGYGLSTITCLNCYSFCGSGDGIYTVIAENCYGYSTGSGYGIAAEYIANGCFGYSASGTGLDTFIASVCHGASTTGTPLSVSHNVNSF